MLELTYSLFIFYILFYIQKTHIIFLICMNLDEELLNIRLIKYSAYNRHVYRRIYQQCVFESTTFVLKCLISQTF